LVSERSQGSSPFVRPIPRVITCRIAPIGSARATGNTSDERTRSLLSFSSYFPQIPRCPSSSLPLFSYPLPVLAPHPNIRPSSSTCSSLPFRSSSLTLLCSPLLFHPSLSSSLESVIKTRMQSLSARTEYRNFIHCGYRIFTEEGVLRFWKGTTPRLARLTVRLPSSLPCSLSPPSLPFSSHVH
jgi:hypothetical protein